MSGIYNPWLHQRGQSVLSKKERPNLQVSLWYFLSVCWRHFLATSHEGNSNYALVVPLLLSGSSRLSAKRKPQIIFVSTCNAVARLASRPFRMTCMCTADDTPQVCREFGVGRFIFTFLPSFAFWKRHLSGYCKERVVIQIYIDLPKHKILYTQYTDTYFSVNSSDAFPYAITKVFGTHNRDAFSSAIIILDVPGMSLHIWYIAQEWQPSKLLNNDQSRFRSRIYPIDDKWTRWRTNPIHDRSAPGDLRIP